MPEPEPKPARRRRDDGYELRVVSIEYLGDNVAAAQAIEEFLRLSRAQKRQRAIHLQADEGQDA